MKNTLGRIVLLIHEYEETLEFYQKKLGFQVLFDQTMETGQRYLHMTPSKGDSLAIWFLKAESETQKQAIGNQTKGQPTLVLYTDSFEEMHKRLLEHKIRIKKQAIDSPDAKFLHFLDLYGNEIVLVQLKAGS